jgi:hypothetical protein
MGNSRTVEITITMFTNTVETNVLFGGDSGTGLNFGDRSPSFYIPEQQNMFLPELGGTYIVGYASYTVAHTYSSFGKYTVSYSEPYRNAGIMNFDNPIGTPIYFESEFTLRSDVGNYESPSFLYSPIFFSPVSAEFSGSIGASDANNYTLYYKEMVPLSDRSTDVVNFVPLTNFNVNPHNGLITWDGSFKGGKPIGEFLTCVKIRQFDDEGNEIGYMNVDCQLIRTDDENPGIIDDDADLNQNGRIYTDPGTTYKHRIFAIAETAETILLTAKSELTSIEGAMEFSTYDSIANDHHVKVGVLTLTNLNQLGRTQPFVISIRAKFGEGNLLWKDRNYVFYSTDTELPETPMMVTATQEKVHLVQLSPNPSRGEIMLSCDITEPVELVVMTLSGTPITTLTAGCGQGVDTQELPPGLYIVLVKDHNKAGSFLVRKLLLTNYPNRSWKTSFNFPNAFTLIRNFLTSSDF